MAPPIHRTMNATEWAMLIMLSLLWGGSFFFIGLAVHELPPLTIVVLRVGLGALILNLIILAMGQRLPTNKQAWDAFIGMGFLGNALPFALIVWAQTRIGSGFASILNATTPLFGVIVAQFLTTDEKITPWRLIGVVMGFLGVAVMIGLDIFTTSHASGLAELACLTAALSYAFSSVFGRRFSAMNIPPIATAAGMLSAATIIMLPIALVLERPWQMAMPSTAAILSVLALATLSTAFAYIVFFRLLSTAGATNLLLVTFLVPVSALILATSFLGEQPSLHQLAGMLLIGLGLAAIDGRLPRRILSTSSG